ncbi:BMP family lipoprotein [Salinarimonas ramus]|uniref:BMP family ABC transporter substrate-binding protein n=1 Tax=Salinarimonas ramus TaxID=690164 RepID=A0A917Q403_9HYPH|nr:BMP family ABC transporter substrate-binding protein [Salinarimonas ramus]GGK20012.1 BMP family ABC transporter substrate-binding protein [Salinarimonas ramus]
MKKTIIALLGATALAFAAVGPAAAQDDVRPAIIYDLGGKFDRSFNEGVFNGATRFQEESGVEFREFEPQNDAQREQAMRRFAQQGFSPILAVGFSQQSALERVAAEFPETEFAIIDSVVDLPNVASFVFKEHEGSYLVGMLAALASESGTVGFVGGMDIPLIRKFACGYAQGVKAVNPDAEVIVNMTGTTGAAWNDPVRGGELTRSQIEQGADVIYHAAGGTGIGVLRAAADAGALGIGVDSNQNMLHPGSVLTSMLKRVDNATEQLFTASLEGSFEPGLQVLGLAEDGVGWALDENNESLITQEMQDAVAQAREQIVSGEVEVHDYMTDSSCPAVSL